jgi:hypothetical protein
LRVPLSSPYGSVLRGSLSALVAPQHVEQVCLQDNAVITLLLTRPGVGIGCCAAAVTPAVAPACRRQTVCGCDALNPVWDLNWSPCVQGLGQLTSCSTYGINPLLFWVPVHHARLLGLQSFPWHSTGASLWLLNKPETFTCCWRLLAWHNDSCCALRAGLE